jgi:hypothetical protein
VGKKKKKKNPGINPGQPAGKGEKKTVTDSQPTARRKKRKKKQRHFRRRKCLWPVLPQKTLRGTSTHEHTHGHTH